MQMTIREWRNAKEISQQQAADALGIHVNTYRAWEENPGEMAIKNVHALAALFSVSVDDFFIADTLQNVEGEG